VRSIDIPGVCLDLPIISSISAQTQMPSKGKAGGRKSIGSKNAIEKSRGFCPKRRGSAVFHLKLVNIISAGGDDE
jgi:hypothetical protein